MPTQRDKNYTKKTVSVEIKLNVMKWISCQFKSAKEMEYCHCRRFDQKKKKYIEMR